MSRFVLPVLVASFVVGCTDFGPATPSLGALRIHGVVGQGELHVDGVPRGPVQAEQRFEGLTAGVHLIDLRREGVTVASMPVEVRAGMILDARIDAVPSARPIPRAVNVAAGTAPTIAAVVEVPGAASRVQTAPEPSVTAALEAVAPSAPEPPPITAAAPSRSRTRASSDARAPRSRPRDRHEPDEIDTLLERALERGPSTRELAALSEQERSDVEGAVSGPVLEHLSTSDIASVMRLLRGRAAECGASPGDTFLLDVELSGATGRAERVLVRGPLARTVVASCVQTGVWELLFPRFSRDRQRFSWSMQL